MRRHSASTFGIIALSAWCSLVFSSCRSEEELPLQIVGRGSSGAAEVLPVGGRLLLRGLQRSLREVDPQVLSRLEASSSEERFYLDRVTVGLKLVAEAELLGLFEGELEGVVELRYQPLPL
jgi:hypothetical protein